jgi:hypothetical protein
MYEPKRCGPENPIKSLLTHSLTFSPFRTVYKRSQHSNFLCVNFLDTFSTDSKLASNSAFFIPILKIFTKNTFGVILALFANPHGDRRVIQPNRIRKHYCTAPPYPHPPFQCGKVFLPHCSYPTTY